MDKLALALFHASENGNRPVDRQTHFLHSTFSNYSTRLSLKMKPSGTHYEENILNFRLHAEQ
jgi:hypothetical protein